MDKKIFVQNVVINSSAICNLRCTYCYVAHSKEANKVNKEIRDKIESLEYFKKVSETFTAEKITSLELWGAEPTINLDSFAVAISKDGIQKYLPNLEQIGFSTNLSSKKQNLEKIFCFLEEINKLNKKIGKKITVNIQVSIDGPGFIHDINRNGSNVEEVLSNMRLLRDSEFADIIQLGIKATLDNDNIKKINSDKELFNCLIAFDDMIHQEFGFIYAPTITMPGEHTQSDGIEYAKFVKTSIENEKPYFSELYSLVERMHTVLKVRHHTGVKELIPSSMYCSAGNGSMAMDYDYRVHVCQGSFMIQGAEEINITNEETRNLHREILSYASADSNSNLEKAKLGYVMDKANNSFWFRKNQAVAAIKILSVSGQISKSFQESSILVDILATIVIGVKSCIVSNILTTGGWSTTSGPTIKLFGNGALEIINNAISIKEKELSFD